MQEEKKCFELNLILLCTSGNWRQMDS